MGASDKLTVPAARPREHGRFDIDKDRVAAVDHDGNIYVTVTSELAFAQLRDAGYKRGRVRVPFANGEKPLGVDVKHKLRLADNRARLDHETEGMARRREAFVERTGQPRSTLSSPRWALVDRMTVRTSTGEVMTYPMLERSSSFPDQDPLGDAVGTYAVNNGTIAALDEQGRTWVAGASDAALNELQKSGFTKGDFEVPFSNGERPVFPKDRARADTALAGTDGQSFNSGSGPGLTG